MCEDRTVTIRINKSTKLFMFNILLPVNVEESMAKGQGIAFWIIGSRRIWTFQNKPVSDQSHV